MKEIHITPDYEGGTVNDRLILMQYTGLKDRQGVEIYEGDIVKRYEAIGQVMFTTGGFDVDGLSANTPGFGFFAHPNFPECLWDSDCLEVIGNIYENPDLLNNDKISN